MAGVTLRRDGYMKHGMSHARQYRIWDAMRQRCSNSKTKYYYNYGGRGITVCERWMKFENFWEDMGIGYRDGLSIDRIDNNGNYCKENCKWSTKEEQDSNRRVKKDASLVTYKGVTKHLAEWSRILGIKRTTLGMRLTKYGWSVERSFSTPIGG